MKGGFKIVKAFIQYIKTQKELLINLMNKKKSDREKVLNEINDKIEKMNLEIKISELDDRIVIISATRDKFKGKILNLFLIKIFGEEYRNNVWEIQEEYENQKYAEINNFFDLLAKKYEEGNSVFIEEISEENFDIKEKSDPVKLIKTNNNLNGNAESTGEAINLKTKYGKQKNSVFNTEDVFLKHPHKYEENIEEINNSSQREKIDQEIRNNIKNLSENSFLGFVESELKNDINNKSQENPLVFNDIKFKKYEKLKREIEIKEEKLLELINETKFFLEEKKFCKAVQNVNILAKADKSAVLNEERIKYSLEGILLRVIRFFVQRNMKNSEYWRYFTDRYEEKRKFYNDIVNLREYCGLRLNLENEEYEVKRRD